ncbi:MAG: 30S ribosomal protein S16, partial [Bacteroidia bacterium]|nr:30S ribosomal protein S16 [Bacteroidia bacterium]MDW8334822.1 30S ribosomal protein S16 [Bacteroidia bacterium]
DARSPRDGRFIELLGSYDPNKEFDKYRIDHEKALKWLKNGAQPTETARSILSREGVMLRFHLYRKGKSEEEIRAVY